MLSKNPVTKTFTAVIILIACTIGGFNKVRCQILFNANIAATPVSLNGANGSCASPGTSSPNVFSVNVTNVGILSSSKALCRINVTFTNCTGSFNVGSNTNPADNGVQFRLMAPDGTCFGVYSGGLSSSYNGTLSFALVSSTSCLNNPNTANMPSGATANSFVSNSNSGFFAAGWNGTGLDLTSSFNGVNANGTWKLIFSETTVSPPCLSSASLVFGNPSVNNQIGNGDDCSNPIVWDGGPICASTGGMTSSSQMPGWQGPGLNTWGNFNGGVSCDWNFANNNDVWIRFVAQSNQVCINISGLDFDSQSVVVSDPNTDGDNNPCTGSGGGRYWNLISCPRPSIYGATAGTSDCQNHCFSATAGQTYYLVVDGNGGAETPFYVVATSGTINTLPVELIAFNANYQDRIVHIDWQTASEMNNDFFTIERSNDGLNWEVLDIIDGAGNSDKILSYQTFDQLPHIGVSYYRLKQVDYDGKSSFSEIRSVHNMRQLTITPNPSSGKFVISGLSGHNKIRLMDMSGKILEMHSIEHVSCELDLTDRPSGMYMVMIPGSQPIRILKE
ncbi:MAG: T9SS type A sorting domain-containing protein [Flavobacteriia bacterium]